MALEFSRIHNAAYTLYQAKFAEYQASVPPEDAAARLHQYYIKLIEEALVRTSSYDQAKKLYGRLPRPSTVLKEKVVDSWKDHWEVERSLSKEVDEIHALANAAIKQAWKQLEESGI